MCVCPNRSDGKEQVVLGPSQRPACLSVSLFDKTRFKTRRVATWRYLSTWVRYITGRDGGFVVAGMLEASLFFVGWK